ncbi:LysR family transcriptional regulator [Arhodomonas sp. SL1]|uniref:LysR family transcriptional regulator n=1 Tax=Arhodomonas sp. SL1 TaxID=3425691 RepID=UPI003F8811B8
MDEFDPSTQDGPRDLDERFLRRHLKLRQLVILDAVLEERSLLKAAETLKLTQPAVTKAVKAMEEVLSVPLLERTPRGVRPTAYGEAVRTRIKAILNEVRHLGDDLTALSSASGGHVMAGTMISAAAWLLPQAIVMLKRRSPGIIVTVQEGINEELFPRLAAGELDIVVGRIPYEVHPGIRHEPLYEEQLAAVGRPGHPAAGRGSVEIEDLDRFPWIIPTSHGPVRLAIERMFRRAGRPLPANRIHSLSILTNIQVMQSTDTVCLLPLAVAEQYVSQDLLTILPLTIPEHLGPVGLSIATSRPPTPATTAFLQAFRAAVRARG